MVDQHLDAAISAALAYSMIFTFSSIGIYFITKSIMNILIPSAIVSGLKSVSVAASN